MVGEGERRLRTVTAQLPARDALVMTTKLDELAALEVQMTAVEAELEAIYHECPDAQRLDAIRGIGVVSAVSIVARIGPVKRFRNAEHLIAFAGLAPGVHQSDGTRRDGRIGGGGTDESRRAGTALSDRGDGVGPRVVALQEDLRTSGEASGQEDRSAGGSAAVAAQHLQGHARRCGIRPRRQVRGVEVAATRRDQPVPERQVDPRVEPHRPNSDSIRLPENWPTRSQTIIGPSRGDAT